MVGGPYVMLTNTTASTAVILMHLIALWLVVPPLMALFDSRQSAGDAAKAGTSSAASLGSMFHRLAAVWAALSVAVAMMLVIIHLGAHIPWDDLLVPALASAMVPIFSWYCLIVIFEAWQASRERALRLEATTAQAAWTALSARIQPHFLFNSLASLEQLTVVDPPRAAIFVRRLAGIYRRVLAAAETRLTPLSEELALVEDYLHIQKTRFADRLTVVVEAPAELSAVKVPPTLLLTLVENAIKHGVEAHQDADTVRLCVRQVGQQVVIQVTNRHSDAEKGNGLRVDKKGGYGHRDVTERLRLAFGDRASFRFHRDESQAVAEVHLPEATP